MRAFSDYLGHHEKLSHKVNYIFEVATTHRIFGRGLDEAKETVGVIFATQLAKAKTIVYSYGERRWLLGCGSAAAFGDGL